MLTNPSDAISIVSMNQPIALSAAELLRRPPPPRRPRPGLRALVAAFADGLAAVLDIGGVPLRGRTGRFLSADPSAADARALRRDFERVIGRYEPLLRAAPRPGTHGEAETKTT